MPNARNELLGDLLKSGGALVLSDVARAARARASALRSAYLHHRVDNTILGRVNNKRGIPNYESFDEYVMEHMGAAVAG